MTDGISLEMLAFNLKLLGRKSRKKVLISAGKLEDKKRMFPAIQQFLTLEVDVYSTPGTHKFLLERGIESTEIHKITDRRSPNIQTFLEENRFDLVINVLTGDNDYDEASDAKLIRKLCIENGIPLITDCDVGIATLQQRNLPLQARR
jgi:cytosine/creatinine deaminase